MTDEEKKAIEHLERMKEYKNIMAMNWSDGETLLNLIEKQEKVIDEMAEYITNHTEFCMSNYGANKEEWKQYFYRKVEENEKEKI